MGRKAILPYGLYKGVGFVNPHFAKDTTLNAEDLTIFWQALQKMWDFDRSASRGLMAIRGLYVFTHEDGVGNAPAHTLFERVRVKRKDGIEAARQFEDYSVIVDEKNLPGKVKLTRLVG